MSDGICLTRRAIERRSDGRGPRVCRRRAFVRPLRAEAAAWAVRHGASYTEERSRLGARSVVTEVRPCPSALPSPSRSPRRRRPGFLKRMSTPGRPEHIRARPLKGRRRPVVVRVRIVLAATPEDRCIRDDRPVVRASLKGASNPRDTMMKHAQRATTAPPRGSSRRL